MVFCRKANVVPKCLIKGKEIKTLLELYAETLFAKTAVSA